MVVQSRAIELGLCRGDGYAWGKWDSGSTASLYREDPAAFGRPSDYEIADSLENLQRCLPTLDEMIKDGLVTLEKVRVIQYKARGIAYEVWTGNQLLILVGLPTILIRFLTNSGVSAS